LHFASSQHPLWKSKKKKKTSEMAAAAAGVDRIRSAARNLEAQSRSMIEDYDANILMAKMVAEDLERDNNTASVKEMEEVTLEIIKFSDKLRHHSLALQELSNEYLPKAEVCDFLPF
jgi:hypothetical protein